MTPVDPPDSPPQAPVIPEGLATKLGKYGALVAAVLAALAGVFDVELNTETLAAFVGSIVLLVTTMWGRFKQAEAIYRDAPSPFQVVTDYAASGGFDEFEDFIEEKAPGEEDLKETFPEDPPQDPMEVPAQQEQPSSSALGLSPENPENQQK
jgi:hypothetical protein